MEIADQIVASSNVYQLMQQHRFELRIAEIVRHRCGQDNGCLKTRQTPGSVIPDETIKVHIAGNPGRSSARSSAFASLQS